jgi:hypothetical protein
MTLGLPARERTSRSDMRETESPRVASLSPSLSKPPRAGSIFFPLDSSLRNVHLHLACELRGFRRIKRALLGARCVLRFTILGRVFFTIFISLSFYFSFRGLEGGGE